MEYYDLWETFPALHEMYVEGDPDGRYERARAIVHAALNEGEAWRSIARRLGISSERVRQIFRAATGGLDWPMEAVHEARRAVRERQRRERAGVRAEAVRRRDAARVARAFAQVEAVRRFIAEHQRRPMMAELGAVPGRRPLPGLPWARDLQRRFGSLVRAWDVIEHPWQQGNPCHDRAHCALAGRCAGLEYACND